MNHTSESDRTIAEGRFAEVFAQLEFLVQYAYRRGARDPDAIAAEAMTIAWRRLADVPTDDPRPWLIVTARNLLLAERRRESTAQTQPLEGIEIEAPVEPSVLDHALEPQLDRALRALSDQDREALMLIAWDDLSPKLAARSLGISATAFRVRLHRARRRLGALLDQQGAVRAVPSPHQNWSHAA